MTASSARAREAQKVCCQCSAGEPLNLNLNLDLNLNPEPEGESAVSARLVESLRDELNTKSDELKDFREKSLTHIQQLEQQVNNLKAQLGALQAHILKSIFCRAFLQ